MADGTVDRSAQILADREPPAGLTEAFWRYERALMADDVPTLDALFAPGEDTLRGDADGLLVGHDAIAAFRRGRRGAPARQVAVVHVRVLDERTALLMAELVPATGGRGQQTQLWRRSEAGWQVAAAHVSGPRPAIDPRIWRVVGTPLVRGSASGLLASRGVAVKDLFAVEGQRIGAGVPEWFEGAPVERTTARAVQALLDAGADVTGVARTDEFAYSMAGVNPHFGTPPNGRVPGGLPGGSSSGPASAVALGQAAIGLGTDTGGSIRVPASYQGLWGLRTTHGRVPRDGLLALAPTFDTVGWLTRDPETLATCARVSAPGAARTELGDRVVVAPALLEGLGDAIEGAFRDGVARLAAEGRLLPPETVDLARVDEAREAFRVVQAAEAWALHGPWLRSHPDAVVGAVAERFRIAAAVTPDETTRAREALAACRRTFASALGDAVLLLPSAASPAPSTAAPAAAVDLMRRRTLRLTCVAGVLGAPALSVPLLEVGGAPLGLCLVGPRDADDALVDLGARLVR